MNIKSLKISALLCACVSLSAVAPAYGELDVAQALQLQPYPMPEASPGRVLIRNATIWTQESDGILDNTDLLIEDGRIAKIGKQLEAPRGALIIDATGKHVTPGIIDAHSHSATEDLNINEGVYSVSAEVRVQDILDPRSSDIYQQLAGGVTTIHVLHGSANTIGGQNVIMKMRWGAETPDELVFTAAPPTIKFALGENVKQSAFAGPGFGGGRKARYPATRMGVSALIRASFERAAQYRDEWQRYDSLSKRQKHKEAPPRRDLQLEALVEVLEGKRFVHTHAYRADEILMLMRVADEVGFKVDTFQHVLEGYKVADEMAAHGASGSTFSDWWSFKMEAYDAIAYNAVMMEERGVLTSLNSDDSNLARRLNYEAAKMQRYGGLNPENALAMVTINPARQLHIEDRVGSLAAGKDADIVIWNGDPLSVFTMAETTFVDGQVRFNREADLAHRKQVTAARELLIADVKGEAASSVDKEQTEVSETTINPPALQAAYQFSPYAPAQPAAIIGATVHTMEGTTIADGVVVFEAGRITVVGGADTPIPAGAERFDASGKHLWPGIIHTNTVLGISEIDSVAGSVDVAETGDVNADADVSLAVNAASEHFPVARSGGITHAVVLPRGGMIAGTNTVMRTDGWTWEEMAAVRNHSLVVRWPDAIPARYAALLGPPKSLADRKKESKEFMDKLNEVMDEAEAYHKAVTGMEEGGRPVKFDPQLDALQPVVTGTRPLWVSAADKHAIEAAIQWAASRQLRIVITGAKDAYLLTDLLAEHNVPVVLPAIAGDPPREDDPYDALYTLPAKLEAAGVPFAIASGTRSGGSSNARHLTLFAGIAAAHGLDREAAYRSVTLYPAQILGLDHVLGSIAPNKSASFVLTDGDLLEPGTSIEQVWIDGVKPSMDDVQKAAYRKWGARPHRPVVN
jgi:imidazolonepropionase-like amidohydrolase